MDNKISSVGKVQTQSFESKETLILESGDQLESLEMIFETYGNLNPERTNAILVCHALSGNHHSAGYYDCLLYTSPSPRDQRGSRMPSSA